MPPITRVFLIGLPLSGKTSVAKALAKALQWPWFDLDQSLIHATGKSITDLFADRGEHGFRLLEHNSLQRFLLRAPPFVLATGGGTPCFYDHMHAMNRAGVTVFLDLAWQDMHARLTPSHRQRRPLLRNARHVQDIEEAFAARLPRYAQADMTLSACLSLGTLVERIKKFLCSS